MNFTPEQAKNLRIVQNDPANQKAIAEAQRVRAPDYSALSGTGQTSERKPDPAPALDGRARIRPVRKGRVAVVVTIIACTNAFTDEDNIIAGAKPLRDAIAASLGVDDGDKRVRFEYGTVQTAGADQYIVRIQSR